MLSIEKVANLFSLLDSTNSLNILKKVIRKKIRENATGNSTKWVENLIKVSQIDDDIYREFIDFYKQIVIRYDRCDNLPSIAGVMECVFDYVFLWDLNINLMEEIKKVIFPQQIENNNINFFILLVIENLEYFRGLCELRGKRKVAAGIENITGQLKMTVDSVNSNIEELRKTLDIDTIFIDVDFIKKQYLDDERLDTILKGFYKVTDNINCLFSVVCNDLEIINQEEIEKLKFLLNWEDKKNLIITGNGGSGKTVLMARIAVDEALKQRPVFWIISDKCDLRRQQVKAFLENVEYSAAVYKKKALICIDNPFANPELLEFVCKEISYSNYNIKIIISERLERLNILFDETNNILVDLNNQCDYLCLTPNSSVKNYWWIANRRFEVVRNNVQWKNKVLTKMLEILSDGDGTYTAIIKRVIDTHKNKIQDHRISLVELQYICIETFNSYINKKEQLNKSVKLDWDMWEELFIYKNKSYGFSFVYMAAMYLFKMPLDIESLSKITGISIQELSPFLVKTFQSINNEPVYIEKNKVYLKHDMVADLFFVFNPYHKNNLHMYLSQLPYLLSNEMLLKFCNLILRKQIIYDKVDIVTASVDIKDLIGIFIRNENICNLLNEKGQGDRVKLAKFWLLNVNGNYKEALSFIKEECESGVFSSRLHLEYAMALKKNKQNDDAEKILKKLISYDEMNILALNELGKLYSDINRYDEAIQYLNTALAVDGNSLPALNEIGRAYVKRGDYNKALQMYKTALKIDHRHIPVLNELGRLYVKMYKYDLAEKTYKRALKIDSSHIPVLNELGRLYVVKREYKEAETIFQSILKLDKNNIPAMNELGGVYSELGEFEKAKECFYKIINKDKDSTIARNELARVYIRKGEMTKGREILLSILEKKPLEMVSIMELGRSYIKSQEYEKALSVFLYGIKINPDNLPLLNELGRLYVKIGKKREAELVYIHAMEVDSAHIPIMNEYGRLLRILKKFDEAEIIYQKAIEIAPKHIPILNEYGELLMRKGDYTAAEDMFKRALEVDDKHIPVLIKLGKLFMKKGERNKAYEIFKQIAHLDSQDIKYMSKLGELLMRYKFDEDAENVFINILKVSPSDIIALNSLAKLYGKRKEYDRAIELHNRILQICPGDIRSFDALGNIYIKLGNFQKAEQILQEGVSLDKNNSYLNASLLRLYRQNNLEKAESFLKVTYVNHSHDVYFLRECYNYFLDSGQNDKAQQTKKDIGRLNPKFRL